MQQNPYSPPKAELEDPAADALEKPQELRRAAKLLWASLAIGIVITILDPAFTAGAVSLETWVVLIATFSILAIFIVFISAGHNWARLLFLLLFVLGAIPYAQTLRGMFDRSMLNGLLSLLQMAIQIWAMYLVFTQPGAAWFKRNK